ncbi:Gfo/Idh/MocA family oxidoreductase [Flammeovirgaceae bacterium SG7u.111]|nr:Gfo/Idh/MocA family oxidoreductase [Flammeovirgaceae bacterium SG7u.132]WPO36819.1 Gfo/Idh/MocA family oxidoreductase [Flammeovirgaceae bacterium SG7u.111]
MEKLKLWSVESSNRREFVKKLGVGVGALALASPLTSWGIVGSAKPKKLGIALVGLGYYSTSVLAPAFQETEHCYLAGIVTGTPQKEKKWQKEYGIKKENTYNYKTFERIADNKEIDIIYIVLPNSMHKEYVIRAAKTGKHIICEKPMALSADECKEMIEACKNAGVTLSIGYRMQHEANTQEVMRMGQEEVFGPVRFVTTGAGFYNRSTDHWKLQKAMGGGAMMDMGVYSLQGARYVTGEEPISVTAQHFVQRHDIYTEVDETTTFQLEFPSGAMANCHTSFAVSMNYLDARATNGWFKLDPFSSYSGIKGESKNGPIAFPNRNQQAKQMDDAAICIKESKPVLVPGEEGLRDMVVVEAIYKAAATGEKVKIG